MDQRGGDSKRGGHASTSSAAPRQDKLSCEDKMDPTDPPPHTHTQPENVNNRMAREEEPICG